MSTATVAQTFQGIIAPVVMVRLGVNQRPFCRWTFNCGKEVYMPDPVKTSPGFVVLREISEGHWQVIGDVKRRPGLPARAARAQAIADATRGAALPGEVYAAVLKSEWRIAQDV